MTLRDSKVGESWIDRAEGFSVPMVCVGDDNEGRGYGGDGTVSVGRVFYLRASLARFRGELGSKTEGTD